MLFHSSATLSGKGIELPSVDLPVCLEAPNHLRYADYSEACRRSIPELVRASPLRERRHRSLLDEMPIPADCSPVSISQTSNRTVLSGPSVPAESFPDCRLHGRISDPAIL